ncbi:RNA polymerase sigma factor [Luteimonas sp. R10]|uniref:RNA polymerase sigma factor n=1 Tax=Luteimonas sp. R10 TaxID=3108176 RepID=UPI00308C193C|nr:RNA polymerase sigma factor [Luteimonas sp. R10]
MATILPFQRPESTTSMPQHGPSAIRGDSPERAHDSGAAWAGLMVRAQDGDRAAYHALLSDISPYLRTIAHRYLGRGADAEDALQEILLVVHDIRHTYERGRPFKPWLATIATRRCIDLLRRRSRRAAHETDAGDALDRLQEASPGPYEATTHLHDSRAIHEAVDGLPPKQQQAIRLLHLEELSLGEASTRSRQSVGALKVACHRALKTLRQALAGKGEPHD